MLRSRGQEMRELRNMAMRSHSSLTPYLDARQASLGTYHFSVRRQCCTAPAESAPVAAEKLQCAGHAEGEGKRKAHSHDQRLLLPGTGQGLRGFSVQLKRI